MENKKSVKKNSTSTLISVMKTRTVVSPLHPPEIIKRTNTFVEVESSDFEQKSMLQAQTEHGSLSTVYATSVL